LRGHPLVLAPIVVNVLFLAFGIWFVRELAGAVEKERAGTKDIITALVETCSRR
jgi:hypothetical protein